jgi:hypothetical protein
VLALMALAVQLVLSFGHIHTGQVHTGQVHTDGLAHATTVIAQADSEHAPVAPAHHGGVVDDCAICASIHLAGTLLSASPPVLAVPPPIARAIDAPMLTIVALDEARAPFQSRAPPRS